LLADSMKFELELKFCVFGSKAFFDI
jgi:hypothetical protein